ncbi:HGGxSTG domain-containing protein [Methylocystis echinoides]|uniref:HGGxSTG domain-containing protein n=1 Tax=Methylocystis echinoides TaxID=29468 RepID=UPI0032E802FF
MSTSMPVGRRSSAMSRPGEGLRQKSRNNPMRKSPMLMSPRCGAKTRAGTPCQSPAIANGRCRMHGGTNPGAPKGNQTR